MRRREFITLLDSCGGQGGLRELRFDFVREGRRGYVSFHRKSSFGVGVQIIAYTQDRAGADPQRR